MEFALEVTDQLLEHTSQIDERHQGNWPIWLDERKHLVTKF